MHKDSALYFHNSNPSYSHTCFYENTSINNLSQNQNFVKVYPNPAASNFTIEINEDYFLGYKSLSIYNSYGKLMMQKNINPTENLISIDVKEFPQGLYFISLLDRKNMRLIKKMVVNK